MKMVYSYKFAIYISLFGIALFTTTLIVCICGAIFSVSHSQMNLVIVYLIVSIGFALFDILSLFALNRLGCKVIYDPNNNIVYRKGFICGYQHKIKVDDILKIVIATFPKETTYYILVEPYNNNLDGISKKSFIKIEKNEDNYKFIMQFWDKPFETI